MSTYTVRKSCNHGLHLFLTIITFGMWGIFVWPFVAVYGRRETVHLPDPPQPPAVRRAPYQLPMPQPNAVNPYNGDPYFDGNLPMRPIEYPPQHPVQYGR